MARRTKIQGCHAPVDPETGCLGCELFRDAGLILAMLDSRLSDFGVAPAFVRDLLEELIAESWGNLPAEVDHTKFSRELTTPNIWYHRHLLGQRIASSHGARAGEEAVEVLEDAVACYRASKRFKKGCSLVKQTRLANIGYASNFERMTAYVGRMVKAALRPDMRGVAVPDEPWLSGLPRLNFVPDMDELFARRRFFAFFEQGMMPQIRSERGRRHLWLMMTKKPDVLAGLGQRIRGFPENFCALTTVTGPATLFRVGHLQQVNAPVRGLLIEPSRQLFDPESLGLNGVHWVLVGGEVGSFNLVAPLDLDWVRRLIAFCRSMGVAVCVNQLGRKPVVNGKLVRLRDHSGWNWDEWPEDLRVREFPRYFHDYRRHN